MQPWRFVVVRSERTKAAMQAIAARERLIQSEHFDERTRQYLDLKIEGIRESLLSICVCCDRDSVRGEVLGRHTIRDTDLYSTCLAIQNLWLAARAEGVGVGWVPSTSPMTFAPCSNCRRASSRSPGYASAIRTNDPFGQGWKHPAGNAGAHSRDSSSPSVGASLTPTPRTVSRPLPAIRNAVRSYRNGGPGSPTR